MQKQKSKKSAVSNLVYVVLFIYYVLKVIKSFTQIGNILSPIGGDTPSGEHYKEHTLVQTHNLFNLLNYN